MVKTEQKLKILEKEIEKCKAKLKDLEPFMYQNSGACECYNRTLVKKAILIDKYKKIRYKKPAVKMLFDMLNFKKPKKLICDYFPNV